MLELQRKKNDMVGATLGGDADAMGKLSVEDLGFLFSS
jgi:SNF2 family DNA or RNA helicase